MNKAQLVEHIHAHGGVADSKAAAERTLQAVLEGIRDGLQQDGNVQLVGFGSFSVKSRAARNGRNPRTGEDIKIKASTTVGFRPGRGLKDSV